MAQTACPRGAGQPVECFACPLLRTVVATQCPGTSLRARLPTWATSDERIALRPIPVPSARHGPMQPRWGACWGKRRTRLRVANPVADTTAEPPTSNAQVVSYVPPPCSSPCGVPIAIPSSANRSMASCTSDSCRPVMIGASCSPPLRRQDLPSWRSGIRSLTPCPPVHHGAAH